MHVSLCILNQGYEVKYKNNVLFKLQHQCGHIFFPVRLWLFIHLNQNTARIQVVPVPVFLFLFTMFVNFFNYPSFSAVCYNLLVDSTCIWILTGFLWGFFTKGVWSLIFCFCSHLDQKLYIFIQSYNIALDKGNQKLKYCNLKSGNNSLCNL